VVVCSALLLIPLAGCAGIQPMRGQETDDLDRKLSTFAFIEQGELVTLIVDTKATRYREATEYIPIEIAIANNGLRQLSLTRESFTLIDEEGNRYPAVSPRELIEGYEFLDLDRDQLAELEGIIFNKFATFTRYPSQFSPTRTVSFGSSSLVRDHVALPKFGYILDFLYFPAPKTGLKGHKLELFLAAAELEDPVFVRFEVK
jgi:hypothetical protein